MSKLRVLLVDDAVVVRRLVADVINADPELEVVGTAPNGRIALTKIPQLRPDLVTLDVEMPEMDGLATLAEIRKTWPRLPVIMFSTLTARGAAATLDALALGATDYVTKPANVGSVAAAIERVRQELIPKIKLFCGRPMLAPGHAPTPAAVAAESTRPRSRRRVPARVELVAIGTSTGGPNALAAILPELPADFPVPIVIVQHMPPFFTRSLAERLDARSAIAVSEAVEGEYLQPAHAYVAPGDFHLMMGREGFAARLSLRKTPHENSCRPAVDVTFRSAAEVYGAGTLAVVLTGMGKDGLRGCEAVWEAGGQVLAQDEATSVVWGMPGFVARAGLAEQVLPLDQIVGSIVCHVRRGRSLPMLAS
jgi:two-component system chemotaxis response regulator CheB